jgi:hypothetical protein
MWETMHLFLAIAMVAAAQFSQNGDSFVVLQMADSMNV